MSKQRLIGCLGNLALCVVVAITAGRLAWMSSNRGLESESPSSLSRTSIEVLSTGEELRIEYGWASAKKHVVLAIEASCPGCNLSVQFYQEAIKLLGRRRIPLIVISPNSSEVIQAWLSRHEIRPAQVFPTVDLATVGLTLTPTLLTVNDKGVVDGIMEGTLDLDEQSDVFANIAGQGIGIPDNTKNALLLSESEFSAQSVPRMRLILDVRPREEFAAAHRAGALNIPHDELRQRAAAELDLSVPIVVDCPGPRFGRCLRAGRVLRGAGASAVSVVIPDAMKHANR